MKHANIRFFFSIVKIDGFKDVALIVDQGGDVMFFSVADGIPAVIPEIVNDQVEILKEATTTRGNKDQSQKPLP